MASTDASAQGGVFPISQEQVSLAEEDLTLTFEPVVGDVRAGDVLHFGFQTAVLSQDKPPLGIINDADLVLHTYHSRAEEVPFGSLPYRQAPFRVLRWPDSQHRL